MTSKVTILDSHSILKSKVFEVIEEKFRLQDGRVFERHIVTHSGAAVILPKLDEKRVLILRQYRHAVREELFEFPAGTIDPGEKPIECASRELTEETNYRAADLRSLGMVYPAPGFCNEIQHMFFATGLTRAEGELDEDEVLEVVELETSRVEQMIAKGEIKDGKSIAIFVKAKLAGLI